MSKTKIEWCDRSWNIISGCTKVSTGCTHCYALRMSKRLAGRYGYPRDDPFRVTLHPDKLMEPLKWKKPQRVFIGSMTDLFHKEVPDDFLDKIFAVMTLCTQHTFLILTKRPERMQSYLSDIERPFHIQKLIDRIHVDFMASSVEEEWRVISGYKGFYGVSNRGRVRRVDNNTKGRRNPEGILSLRTTRGGHYAVCLSLKAQIRQFRVGRLMLEAFTGPPPFPNAEARHRNGNPKDNRIENLCWGSKKDNMADASRHGTAGVWMKSRAKFTSEQITNIRKLRAKGLNLDGIALLFGTHKKHISAICVGNKYKSPSIPWPLPNLYLGVSIEDQETANKRIPILLDTIVAKRFVSVEPMLGPVNLNHVQFNVHTVMSVLEGCGYSSRSYAQSLPNAYCDKLDWVICGCETGLKARPMDIEWARSLRAQCKSAEVPFFMKKVSRGDIPDDLMIREWPE